MKIKFILVESKKLIVMLLINFSHQNKAFSNTF